MADMTAPPWLGHTNMEDLTIFILISVAIIIAIILIISLPAYFLKKNEKKIKQLSKKKEPVAFTNNSNNDITIIATDNYKEIEIQFTLYDKDNQVIKQYIIKELNFTLNEQRVIANLKDFNAYKLGYKIINYK